MIDFKLIKLILFFYGCLQIKIIALKYILMTSIIYKWLQNFKKDFNATLVLTRPNEFCFIREFDKKECIEKIDYNLLEQQKNDEFIQRENLQEDLTHAQYFFKLEKKPQMEIIKSNSFNFKLKKKFNFKPKYR